MFSHRRLLPYIYLSIAALMIAGNYAYNIRHPFNCVVSAAGHYKETRFGAVCEMVINLGVSLVLVKPFGIVFPVWHA